MAVDQQGVAELPLRPLDEAAQGRVVGLIEPLDALQPLGHHQPSCVDLLRITDHPRDGAQPACDAHRARVGEGRQLALEHGADRARRARG